MKIAVYPGSFDPITNGHLDIIKRASQIFDRLIVSVMFNPSKNPVFSPDERVNMIREVTKDYPNVEVDSSSELLVEYAQKKGASVIVKGLRAVSDFEHEFQIALTNRKLNRNIETVFLTTNYRYLYLSSSIVREVGMLGGDIDDFVPAEILDQVKEKLKEVKGGN